MLEMESFAPLGRSPSLPNTSHNEMQVDLNLHCNRCIRPFLVTKEQLYWNRTPFAFMASNLMK